jgi:hypothetical protein
MLTLSPEKIDVKLAATSLTGQNNLPRKALLIALHHVHELSTERRTLTAVAALAEEPRVRCMLEARVFQSCLT